MKSKTAQEHIDSLDFWAKVGDNRQTLVVHFSDAEKAIEIAEQEMRQKAIEAFNEAMIYYTSPACTKDEEALKYFIGALDQK